MGTCMDHLGEQHVSVAEVTGHTSAGGGTKAGEAGGDQVGRALTASRGLGALSCRQEEATEGF